jgi:transposase-like protein
MARSLDSRKVREWKRRMARFQEARESVAQFCRKEGVSAPSFYQWRKRLAQRSSQGKGKAAEATARFTPVRLVAATSVAVELPGGTRLHVPTDPETLRLVIDTLACADARHAGGGPC